MTEKQPRGHFDESGRARMVDVGAKEPTRRTARARARVAMKPGTLRAITSGALAKGDAFTAAKLAGIGAAKRTGELIPLCHPLALEHVDVSFHPEEETGILTLESEVSAHARTGVEMEALAAVSVAALTIYDMCKAAEKGIEIREIVLLEKKGGRSGVYLREGKEPASGAAGGESPDD
jgi:cyclic pyranopterin phosphate synthase